MARIAGIMAAKKTSELIPLCHPIALTKVEVDIAADGGAARHHRHRRNHRPAPASRWKRMTAASVAALTLYDMAKSHRPRHDASPACSWSKSPAASRATCATAMIPVDEALDRIFARIPTLGTETVPLAPRPPARAGRAAARHAQPAAFRCQRHGRLRRARRRCRRRAAAEARRHVAGRRALRRHDGARPVRPHLHRRADADRRRCRDHAGRGDAPPATRSASPDGAARRPERSAARATTFTAAQELLPAGVGADPGDAEPRRLRQPRRR